MNPPRRSFLTGLRTGIASLAFAGAAAAKPASSASWQPARHDKDDWLDRPGTKHRLVFDTTTQEGFSEALLFAGNYIRVNNTDYGLQNSDLSVIIVVRHGSTPFGYTDPIWARYGAPMATRFKFEDPKTKQTPTLNVFDSDIEALAKQGVQIAICSVATRVYAGVIAAAVGGSTDAINAELIGNRVPGSLMVPAGIVAVNRAQERGYSLVRA